ncbi:hypothetical protein H0H92_004887 [Tricholoma furcatifolium]|nr:hypothetical protein H0H92_004887 [Tricholoma furcatifolium]
MHKLAKVLCDEFLMVEPFASVVYNSVLSNRARLGSVARTFVSSSANAVAPDFFTPQPRRVTGKQKAHISNEPEPLHPNEQSREWFGNRHLYWWPTHTHPVMMEELPPAERTPLVSRPPKLQRFPKTRKRIQKTLLVPQINYQLRYASRAASPEEEDFILTTAKPALSEVSQAELKLRRVQQVAQQSRTKVDLDHAWNVFQTSKGFSLPAPTQFSFADKFISAAELRYRADVELGELQVLGDRALTMLEGAQTMPGTKFDQWRLCLVTRALALMGDADSAMEALAHAEEIELAYEHSSGIPYAYEMVLASRVRYQGNLSAMEFIGDQWEQIESYLNFNLAKAHTGAQARAGGSLRVRATRVATEIKDPLPFLEAERWDEKQRSVVGCFFIQSLSYAHMGTEARDVLTRMQQLDLDVPMEFYDHLIRSLARRTGTMNSAIDLFESLPKSDELYYKRLGVHVYGRKGDVPNMEAMFNDIARPGSEEIASLINGYAIAYDVKNAEAAFEKYFPADEDGKRSNSPTLAQYAAVIHAHVRDQKSTSQESITRWLTDLANNDMVPDEHVFTLVLNAFASAGDLNSTMTILQQMRESGIKPNVVTYTIVITLLAHRKDPVSAELVFKRALKEGVVPDNRMIVAVMNAHAEGGSWQGVIRAYDYLMAARVTALSVEVYNTLMKAYVLIGTPFNVVYKFFKRMEKSRAKPDVYTYALLVQSACDANLMKIASDIYYDMENVRGMDRTRNLDVNVYILTILMAGFLHHGDKVKAKAVYDEMMELGVNPSPITFRTILRAYGNERSKESLEIAEAFIKTLTDVPEEDRTWRKPKYDSVGALEHLYSPVIVGWSHMRSPEDVERVFAEMQEAGEPSNIGTMTSLMDVYRRTFNIDAVREIWPEILEMGMKWSSKDWLTSEDDPSETVRGIRGNVLCVPLSIYIDALSAAGLHDEIAVTWKDMRARGFSFDAHNWNHLAVALVRAGQVERAFEIIERVIIPYQELSLSSNKTRDRNPSSPLMSDLVPEHQVASEEEKEEDEVPAYPYPRSNRKLVNMMSYKRTRLMQDFRWEDDSDHEDDFAYHLFILHQISPSWAQWKAHAATRSVLLMAYSQLNEGRLVKPTRPDHAVEEAFDEEERSKAFDLLRKLYKNYPKTMQLVLDWEQRERARMNADKYDRKYTWGST